MTYEIILSVYKMTSLQSYVDSAPEHIGNMLKYPVGSVSTSIVNKTSVQYQAIGSGSYSGTSGVKTINFHQGGNSDILRINSITILHQSLGMLV